MDPLMIQWSDVKEAAEEIQKFCDTVKPELEAKSKRTFAVFRAVEYRNLFQARIVTGLNCLMKVYAGGTEFVHVQTFKPLHGEIHITHYKCGMSGADPLEPLS